MAMQCRQKTAKDMLDLYFVENRAKLLDIASFLDRIDRYHQSGEARSDFRYRAFQKALTVLLEPGENRTKTIQCLFSDPTSEPIVDAVDLNACGAWDGGAA